MIVGKSGFIRLEKGRVDGYEQSQEIPLSTDVTVVGRPPVSSGPDAEIPDIRVRNDYVSRGHLKIYYSYDDRCYMIRERDAGTQNGTFINDKQIEPGQPYKLKDGDLIYIAKVGEDYQVVFRFRESENTLLGKVEGGEKVERELRIDLKARRVWAAGKEVPLRKKEFDLLAFLYQKKGEACSRDEIAENVWAEEKGVVSEETIDTNIHRIREAIEPEPLKPRYIITLPRYGFRLDL
jgi:hypothetical protein